MSKIASIAGIKLPGGPGVYAPWRRGSTLARSALSALVVVASLNVLFILASFTTNLLPRERLRQRVTEAFDSGALTHQDYLPFDHSRGWHQYNDCNILQMLTSPDESAAGRAFGPRTFSAGETIGPCETLQLTSVARSDTGTLDARRYSRYWHGYLPVAGSALIILKLSTVRILFRAIAYSSLIALLTAGLIRREFLGLTAAISIGGLAFWGLPYFGLGLSHALGDAVTMFGIAVLILAVRRWSPVTVMSFAAGYGALVTYFDMLTGSLPTAAGLLVPTVYCLSRMGDPAYRRPFGHLLRAGATLAAFGAGVAITAGIKIGLVTALVRPSGVDAFFNNLAFYATPLQVESGIPGIVRAGGRLVRRGVVMTYGSPVLLVALGLTAAAAWAGATWLAFRRRTATAWADLGAFAVGALAIPVWVTLLQTHTFNHATFMARILLVPIVLSWAAFLWQIDPKRDVSRAVVAPAPR